MLDASNPQPYERYSSCQLVSSRLYLYDPSTNPILVCRLRLPNFTTNMRASVTLSLFFGFFLCNSLDLDQNGYVCRDASCATDSGLNEILKKHKVSESIYSMIKNEELTMKELETFTIDELRSLCRENGIKTADSRRFINAIKSIPGSEASRRPEQIIKKIYLTDKEKQQMSNFDQMAKNITDLIDKLEITKSDSVSNFNNTVDTVNSFCDELASHVNTLRRRLIDNVRFLHIYIFDQY